MRFRNVSAARAALGSAALALVILGSSAFAEPRDVAPVSKVFPYWSDFLALPESERDAITVVYRFKASEPSGAAPEVWADMPDGERIMIDIAPDGRVNWIPDPELLRQNPMIRTSIPKGGASLSVSLEPQLDTGGAIAAADILRAVDQANDAISVIAGRMAWFAPKMKGVGLILDGEAAPYAETADGRRTLLKRDDENGAWLVPMRLARANARIVTGAPVVRQFFTN